MKKTKNNLEIKFARNFKLKLNKRQEDLINQILLGLTDLHNHALQELEDDLKRLKKIPKPGDFKKYYAKHRNNNEFLQLAPTQASQSVYDKLIESYQNVLAKERYKIAGEFYKQNIPSHLSLQEAKELKDSLKEELNEYILLETLKKFKTKSTYNTYSTIPYFVGQYTCFFNENNEFISFSIKHGENKFKNEPEKKINTLRVFKDGKQFYGITKRIEIVKKADGFYACLAINALRSQLPIRNAPDLKSEAGIDFGNKKCLTLSDGTSYDKFSSKVKKRLIKLYDKKKAVNKILSQINDTYLKMHNLTEGCSNSKRYQFYLKKLRLIEMDLKRIREFCGHALTNKILDNYYNIYVEDIKTAEIMEKESELPKKSQKTMKRNISHNSWGELKNQLVYKADWRGNNTVLVPARNTTQTCSNCGYVRVKNKKLKLYARIHHCDSCGFILDRDLNAAINIRNIGQKLSSKI